ncbi:hypothetical protein B0H19DRAFT_1385015 [Mycena capillaripes]|nr:hypothetical protein B0H19DRAFT_1385015 [Mycena capillaripes]
MYPIFLTLALCLAAAARPAWKRANVGDNTGVPCTDAQPIGCSANGAQPGDVVSCVNGQFFVTQLCDIPDQLCVTVPSDNSPTGITFTCATLQEQTALFADAFGGVDNIPSN